MDREDAVRADTCERIFQRHALGHESAGALDQQERGVAFVEVPDGRLDAQGLKSPDAPGAEHQLLVEAHLTAADVKDVCDRSVGLGIVRDVGVQKQHRHATHLDQPDGGVEVPVRQFDRDGQRFPVLAEDAQDRQPGQIEVWIGVFLMPVGIDCLPEVAALVQQPDTDERHGHVAGGLDVVAGEHAQAARVDAHAFVEAVLRAEVADGAGQ